MPVPDVSLVVPVRDEAGNIGPLIGEIGRTLDAAGIAWELFVVDDGSTDGSWEEIAAAARIDGRVEGLRNTHGRGKSAALMTGFGRCRAAKVVMLDGDGQDDPAEIPRMLALLDRDGVGVVTGWKTPRLDPWHKTIPSRVFNALVGWVTGLHLHDHNCGLKALRGDVARSLRLTTDLHRFITVLASLDGHGVIETPVHHRPRSRGASKYGMARFWNGLADLARVAAMTRGRAVHRATAGEPLDPSPRASTACYGIIAALALGGLLGRIGSVASVGNLGLEKRLVEEAVGKAAADGTEVDAATLRDRIERGKRLVRPFLSGNDRSRWLTIRALVEKGTFAIDELVTEPGWDTIDAVAHPDASGRLRLYSSKPPLLAVLCAGPYWVLHRLTGWTLGDHPFTLGRLLLVVFSLLPFGLTILFTCRLIEAGGATDWGRIWAAALIACGTMLSTFAVVLTNHVPAAACVAASAWFVHRIRSGGAPSGMTFAAAGLAAGLAAALELPALAWLAAVLAILARADAGRTLRWTVPAAGLVAAAAFGTNWLAHGTIAPPYAHRATTAAAPQAAPPADRESWNPDNWYDYCIRLPNGRMLQSYWRRPRGIDVGEPSAATYAWHALVGHHGIFSLTPAWLLAIPGLWWLVRDRRRTRPEGAELGWAIAVVSLVVLAFYLTQPQHNRNYGGMTSGFRWAFWLAPLWVLAALPTADRLGRSRLGRALAVALLAWSVASVAYPTWNPWTNPWIQQWMIAGGWLPAS